MVTQSDYKETEVQICFSVLLELMTILGEFRDNIVIVGGSVPPLLIPDATEKHPGTLDIDIALDFKRIDDSTYKTIVQTLKERGYYQKENDQPFRFYRDVEGKTIEIDLLAGEYGGSDEEHRHQAVQDAKARKARGCDLVFDGYIEIELTGKLPEGAENKVKAKIANIGPFLVTKGMALWTRMKEKDAFDIYYCLKNYPGGIKAITEKLKPLSQNKLAREGLGKIKAKFETVNSVGPNSVASFLEISNPEEREIRKREAFELVNQLMDDIGIASFIKS
jgi:hypothetical protein